MKSTAETSSGWSRQTLQISPVVTGTLHLALHVAGSVLIRRRDIDLFLDACRLRPSACAAGRDQLDLFRRQRLVAEQDGFAAIDRFVGDHEAVRHWNSCGRARSPSGARARYASRSLSSQAPAVTFRRTSAATWPGQFDTVEVAAESGSGGDAQPCLAASSGTISGPW